MSDYASVAVDVIRSLLQQGGGNGTAGGGGAVARIDRTGFQQASLEIEGEAPIKCWFNPKEYSVEKSNTWNPQPATGTSLPAMQFGGGQPRKLTLDLLFDSSDTNKDVRDVTDRLLKMMEVSSQFASSQSQSSGRPPMVTFSWGSVVSFKAVCTSLNMQFTLFKPDGTPIRATAKMTLTQAERAEDASSRPGTRGTNPTTRGGRLILGSHVVRDGDSIHSIAYGAYGDPTQWRHIAEANDIDDPLRLERGTALSIPRLER